MKLLDSLQEQLNLADMDEKPSAFLLKCTIPSFIFAINITVLAFFLLRGTNIQWYSILLLPVFFVLFMFVCTMIPASNAQKIGRQIEADIFVPARMLVTLLESGNSLLSAFERVSKTNTISGRYFGKIAAEIYLGKNLNQAIEDAIHYTPSRSFKRVLEPVKNSLRTGAAIEKNLIDTLEDLTEEKVVEIERYEKRLAPVSMFYMIFGTILPTIAVVGLVVLLSIAGLTITFFPFLFLLLFFIILMQFVFFRVFKGIRPLVKL